MIPYAGGCRCGAVRYVGHAAPTHTFYCHCTDCQKETGGPFAAEIYVPRGSVEIHGELTAYTVTGDSGKPVIRTFCRVCGCPLTTEFASDPSHICVKACSLDDATWLLPQFHLYVDSKQPWFPILDGLPQYRRDFEW
jgi:hypothetical protein